MVNRVIPDDQQLMTVNPEMPASEALALMKEHDFSQVPVVQGSAVLGLFSYRAFALEVAEIGKGKADPTTLPVEEFLEHEELTYARLTDEFSRVIESLNRCDAVVVSGPNELVALLTPMDLVAYLHSVANAFVLLQEIELAVRKLIQFALPDPNKLAECIRNALGEHERARRPPERLEEMAFNDYIQLIRDGRNWRHFQVAFGGTRERANGKLEPIRDLRNDIFHFKREPSITDQEKLSRCRDWLHRRIRNAEILRGDDR